MTVDLVEVKWPTEIPSVQSSLQCVRSAGLSCGRCALVSSHMWSSHTQTSGKLKVKGGGRWMHETM